MPSTTNAALPYPALTDPPNGPSQIQALAQALDTVVFPTVAWQAFTPTWTAATANPTLGNGTLLGRYIKLGRYVNFYIGLTIGSTTVSGAGAFTFGNLPVASTSSREQRVNCSAFAAGPFMWTGLAVIAAGASNLVCYLPRSSTNNTLGLAQSADSTNTAGTGVPLRSGNYSFTSAENLIVHGVYESVS